MAARSSALRQASGLTWRMGLPRKVNTRVACRPCSLRRTDRAISFRGTECGLRFFVLAGRDPEVHSVEVDVLPLQVLDVRLPQPCRHREQRHVGDVRPKTRVTHLSR